MSDNGGVFEVDNSLDKEVVEIAVPGSTSKAGTLQLRSNYNSGSAHTGSPETTVTLSAGGDNGGYLSLKDNSTSSSYNDEVVKLGVNNNATTYAKRSGYLDLNSGYSDNRNMVWLGARTYQGAGSTYYYGGGQLAVYDINGNSQAGVYAQSTSGTVWGDTKSFVVDHPLQSDKVIVYTSLEGSTVDMYHRGTYQLNNGYAEVALPEHFTVLADEEGMSATTPRSVDSKGLAIVAIKPDRLVVQELSGGKGNYMFDYNIIAVRARHRDHEVVQDWAKWRQPVPDEDTIDEVPEDVHANPEPGSKQ